MEDKRRVKDPSVKDAKECYYKEGKKCKLYKKEKECGDCEYFVMEKGPNCWVPQGQGEKQ
jgi:hypothetical protein